MKILSAALIAFLIPSAGPAVCQEVRPLVELGGDGPNHYDTNLLDFCANDHNENLAYIYFTERRADKMHGGTRCATAMSSCSSRPKASSRGCSRTQRIFPRSFHPQRPSANY
jgi:hypothetical protein